jgi:hypothetical protein
MVGVHPLSELRKWLEVRNVDWLHIDLKSDSDEKSLFSVTRQSRRLRSGVPVAETVMNRGEEVKPIFDSLPVVYAC